MATVQEEMAEMACPKCKEPYSTGRRGLEKSRASTCPHCGQVVKHCALSVLPNGVFQLTNEQKLDAAQGQSE
jgi:DNA-directed RNA polymerase subunit RPC12/RpoP